MRSGRAIDLVVRGKSARFRGRRFSCRIGRGGVRTDKREGDGATPAGRFRALSLLYRPDRASAPRGSLLARQLRRRDGWSDDSDDPDYNCLVRCPHRFGSESLWLPTRLYDLVVPLDYNRDPIRPGRGSAIFLHVAHGLGKPTAGCVAFARRDLLWILARWVRASRVIVH